MNPIRKITPTEWSGERKSKWEDLRHGIQTQARGTSQVYHLADGVSTENARKAAYNIAKKYGYTISVSVWGRTLKIFKKESG